MKSTSSKDKPKPVLVASFFHAHAKLIEQDSVCTRRFGVAGTTAAPIEVTATLLTRGPRPNGPRWYRVKIKRTAPSPTNPAPYSLINIGVQAHCWHVALITVSGKNVVLTREDPADKFGPYTGAGVIVHRRLRRLRKKGSTTSIEELTWMLNFDGPECELVIASRRPLARYSASSIITDHDISPPPPEGGGEEEEEGEGDDGEAEDGGQ